MNRIYKVIWNKARGMYVVVSELAKNHTKSSGSTMGSRKGVRLLSAVAAAVIMSLSNGYLAEAAISTAKADADGKLPANTTVITGDASDVATNERVTNVKNAVLNDTAAKYETKADAAATNAATQERITNVKNAVLNDTAAKYETKADADAKNTATQERITNVKNAVLNDTAAKYETKADAAARNAATQERITNVKEAVLNDTAAKYETKDDAAAANTALDQKISIVYK